MLKKIDSLHSTPPEEDNKRTKLHRLQRVASEFLEEKCRLGPLMFLPGRVLHLEEEEEEGGGVTR